MTTRRRSSGFSLTEALVIVATISVLAAVLLPSAARSRESAQCDKCLNNMRQLMLAAKMYADDNGGKAVPNQPEGDGTQVDWVTVEMDWGNITYNGGAVCTNWQLLTNRHSGSSQYYSLLTPYIMNPFVYRCPSDPSAVDNAPRVRSYSANGAWGTCWSAQGGWNTVAGGPVTGQWLSGSLSDAQTYGLRYQKFSDMIRPSPATLLTFVEENPNSINDNTFAVQIFSTSSGGDWIDVPADYHNQAASFSFADGHAECHRWLGGLVGTVPYSPGASLGTVMPSQSANTVADLADLNWVQGRTSAPVNQSSWPTFPQP